MAKMKQLEVKTIPLDTTVLIEASAGTGKTYTIGLLVLRLLLEKLVKIDKIVLITFTDAAALELKKKSTEKILEAYEIWERKDFRENDDLSDIVEKAGSAKNRQEIKVNLLDAIARIDEMPVFTIHGFCKKLLAEFAFETGNYEEKEVVTNIDTIKENAIAKFWRDNIKDLDAFIKLEPKNFYDVVGKVLNHPHALKTGEDFTEDSIKKLVSLLNAPDYGDKKKEKEKAEAEKKLKFALIHKFAHDIYDSIQKEKRKLKVMHYSDMIEDCYNGIIKDEGKNILRKAVQNRYDAIMVDEFQDTDSIQFKIFEYLFKEKPFFMIGDPKQAIYRFRGGDIFAYKEARKIAGENQYSMNTNYRSEKTLLDALNVFFSSDSFKNEDKNSLMGEGIDYIEVECGQKESNIISEKDGHYKPFVIIRGNYEKDESGNTVKVNGSHGPTEYDKPDGDFKSKIKQVIVSEIKRLLNTGEIEPKDIAILLCENKECIEYKDALIEEGIPSIVKGAAIFKSEAAMFIRILLNAVCYNNNVKFIRALLTTRYCGYMPDEIKDADFIEWSKIIFKTREIWEKSGIMKAIEHFMRERNIWSRILNDLNGERNITNIRQITEILNEEEIITGKVPEKLNMNFARLCAESEDDEETEEKLETDDDALKIMTIHKSKGLQFNIVFAPNINKKPERKFPYPYLYHDEKTGEKTMNYHVKDVSANDKFIEEENEEQARLLYVALTRAKFRLYASYLVPAVKNKNIFHNGKGQSSLCRKVFFNFLNSKPDLKNIQIAELDDLYLKDYEYEPKSKAGESAKHYKSLSRKIAPSWDRTSFSGIAKKMKHPDFIFSGTRNSEEPPAGKRMGTLLHEIFENIEFNAGLREIEEIVKNKFSHYKEFSGDAGEKKLNWIIDKVNIILNKELPGKIRLCEIDDDNKAAELNFFMSSPAMKLEKIKDIMKDKINEFETEDLFAQYIKGVIDLVFKGKDGKYYILDWKSNSLNDYSQQGMKKDAMIPHGYHLQYYIYAVALKRWLKIQQKNFIEQFGGVFYIFIRGVNDLKDNTDGIFFAAADDIVDGILELDEGFINDAGGMANDGNK